MGIPVQKGEPADSYYLAILIEVGPLGALLSKPSLCRVEAGGKKRHKVKFVFSSRARRNVSQ